MTPELDAALRYVGLGWATFPCHTIRDGVCTCRRADCSSPGKHPRTPHGLKDATVDPERIKQWGDRWASSNVAVVTGPASSLVVIDIDDERVFESLVETYGSLSDTAEQYTGRGRQLFFRYPTNGTAIHNKTAVGGCPGVDIRGDGGYVIVPPSRHANGKQYIWESSSDPTDGAKLADLPSGWLELLSEPSTPTLPSNDTAETNVLREGQRNDGMFRLAAAMRAKGLSPSAIEAALLQENKTRCDPPLPDREVIGIARSAARYDAPALGTAQPTQWVPFPVDVLPEPLRSYIKEGAEALGCDPAMTSMPTLAVCAGASGLTRVIELKTSWREYPILWCADVAESGTLKSPAQDLAVRPMLELQSERFREYEDERAAWQQDCERYEAERADYRKAKPGARGELPEKPEAPTCIRYVVSDATIESLAPILKENPRGLSLARDELGGWLGGFNQYKSGKGGDLQSWLELHRGGPLLVDRKTGRQTIHVPRAGVSVCGTIQPGVLQRALTPEFFSSGLAARLLFVMPPRRDKRWSDKVVSPGTRDMYTALLRRLLELGFAVDSDDEPRPVVVSMAPDAREVWASWYNRFAGIQAAAVGPLAASLSKLEAYAARLSLLFYIVRSVWEHGSGTGPVVAGDVERATRLADWFSAEQETGVRDAPGRRRREPQRPGRAAASRLRPGARRTSDVAGCCPRAAGVSGTR